MKKHLFLLLGVLTLLSLSSTVHAGINPNSRCADPEMANSPACHSAYQRSGVSQRVRQEMSTDIECDHLAGKLGQPDTKIASAQRKKGIRQDQ